MSDPTSSLTSSSDRDGVNLRLIWPQWQGGGTSSVKEFASEFPLDVARRGYAVGSAVLDAVLPPHDGPAATVPVTMSDIGLEERDGIEAKTVILEQLAAALQVIGEYDPARITTFGGECSVSVAPFSELARRYSDDLAILWIDSHPDVGTANSEYPGYHAMAVAVLTGHGDPEVLELLPATVSSDRVALVGVHSWDVDDYPNAADWGIQSFSPAELHETTRPLLDWVATTGCSRVAIHFDVDTIDSNEIVLGLGAEPGGLTSAEVRRIVADVEGAADVVGFTIAEFIPRQVMHLQQLLSGFPLISQTVGWADEQSDQSRQGC
jgi:arginase